MWDFLDDWRGMVSLLLFALLFCYFRIPKTTGPKERVFWVKAHLWILLECFAAVFNLLWFIFWGSVQPNHVGVLTEASDYSPHKIWPSDWKARAISGNTRGQCGIKIAISYQSRKTRSRRESLVSKLG